VNPMVRDLSWTRVADADLEALKANTSLLLLKLEGSKVTEAGIKKLSDALPRCQFQLSGKVVIGPKDPNAPRLPDPDEPEEMAVDPDRRAAEMLHPFFTLNLHDLKSKQNYEIKPTDKLPDFLFHLRRINAGAGSNFDPAVVRPIFFDAIRPLQHLDTYGEATNSGTGALNLTVQDLEQFQQLPLRDSLETLVVGRLPLTPEVIAPLKSFPKLAILRVDHNNTEWTDELLESLTKAVPGLREISVGGKSPSRITTRGWAALATLKTLSFSFPRLDRETAAAIAAWPELGKLALYTTELDDDSYAELARCPRLHNLMIGTSKIDDKALEHLARIKTLRALQLYGAKPTVTDAGIQKFAAALPKCKITWAGGVIEPRDKSDPLPPDPDEPDAMAVDPDRAAALALSPYLAMDLDIPSQKKIIYLKPGASLPDAPFRLKSINTNNGVVPHPDGPAALRGLLIDATANAQHFNAIRDYSNVLKWSPDDIVRLAASPTGSRLKHLTIESLALTPEVLAAVRRFPALNSLALGAQKADDALLAQLASEPPKFVRVVDPAGGPERPSYFSLVGMILGNGLTDRGVLSLAGLPCNRLKLTGVFTRVSPVERAFCLTAAANPRLEALAIVPADADCLTELAKSPHLKSLAFGGSAVSDAWLKSLAGADKLRVVVVGRPTRATDMDPPDSPNVTEAGVRMLSELLPRCEVHWSGGIIPARDKSVLPLPPDPDEPPK
jgi:hypothetical protein